LNRKTCSPRKTGRENEIEEFSRYSGKLPYHSYYDLREYIIKKFKKEKI